MEKKHNLSTLQSNTENTNPKSITSALSDLIIPPGTIVPFYSNARLCPAIHLDWLKVKRKRQSRSFFEPLICIFAINHRENCMVFHCADN
ncbi:hypothetical protein [Photorhabdus sp. SF281]|uniref:hypothetical protein n=1 Tax=Photorhabdus sp. SF281 TaxID=3459527 RepID=UPI004044AFC2